MNDLSAPPSRRTQIMKFSPALADAVGRMVVLTVVEKSALTAKFADD